MQSVYVAATFPDGSTSTRLAVQSANGVWVATLPATATSGRTASGVRIMADGEDENGEVVTGYILGVADFAVASLGVTPAPEPGATSWQMLYFDTVPGVLRKGDVTKIDGVLKMYNGTAWEPFADLSGCVPTSRTINGKALTDNVSLSGADIPVDATQGAQNISAALAGKQDALSQQQLGNIAAVPNKLDKRGGVVTGPVIINSANAAFSPLTLGFNVDPERVENAVDIIRANNGDIYLRIHDTTLADAVLQRLPRTSGTFALLSDIYAAVQQIAPAWVSGNAYPAYAFCSYNGVVYQNGATAIPSGTTTTPDTSGSGWTAKPVSDLFLPLTGGTMTGAPTIPYIKFTNGNSSFSYSSYYNGFMFNVDAGGSVLIRPNASALIELNAPKTPGTLSLTAGEGHTGNLAALDAQGNPVDSQIPKTDVALKSELRYSLINPTVTTGTDDTDPQNPITYGAVTLVDRAATFIQIASDLDELRITLPAGVDGKVRDFGLAVSVNSGVTPPAITILGNPAIYNPDGTMPELAEGMNLLYFSEIGPYGLMLVKGEQVQQITQ